MRKALIAQLPQLIPHVTSFATIGIIWLNHHNMFHEVDHGERGTLVLNLLLLLVVSFIPYPTAVLGRYGALTSSAVLYGLVLTLLGTAYTILWHHIARRRLSKSAEDAIKRGSPTLRNLVGALGYPIAERCFSCDEPFTDSDQVALISTETGWVCDLPGDLAKYAVWQPGDAEVFHKACWERLWVAGPVAC